MCSFNGSSDPRLTDLVSKHQNGDDKNARHVTSIFYTVYGCVGPPLEADGDKTQSKNTLNAGSRWHSISVKGQCWSVLRSQLEEMIGFCQFKVEAFPQTLHRGATLRLLVNMTPRNPKPGLHHHRDVLQCSAVRYETVCRDRGPLFVPKKRPIK